MVVLVALVAGSCSGKKDHNGGGATSTTDANALTFFKGAPPWGLADRQADRMAEAELPALTAEGLVVHFHAHLDVFDNGAPVTIPAGVGVDLDRRLISPLHTHFDDGVLHVESDTPITVTLGQFLTEWGLRVAGNCIANVCSPDPIAVFVNGAKQGGVATEVEIKPDTEIALVLGTPPPKIPKGYTCADPRDACPATPSP